MPYLNKQQRKHKQSNQAGFSLVEAILGVGVFSLFITAIIGGIVYAQQGVVNSGQYQRAEFLVQEGLEAVRSIRDDAWNGVTLSSTGIEQSGGEWILSGEGTTDTIDDGFYTRTITFADVCRDGSDAIVDCSSGSVDVHLKEATATVEWEGQFGVNRSISSDTILTHWGRDEWTQTDWSGGDGQSLWSDETQYESDDSGVDVSTAGQVQLATNSGDACGPFTWEFTDETAYTYDGTDIQLQSSIASLVDSQGGVVNDIENSNIDTFEFDTADGADPHMIAISGDIYAVAYRGPNDDGWLATVQVDEDGAITSSVVDTFEFDTDQARRPHISHISGDIYAIVYRGPDNDGWAVTVDIDSAGTIGSSIVDSFEFDTLNTHEPKLIHINGDVYAVAHTGTGDDGYVRTFEIDSAGNFGSALLDSYEFDTSNARTPDIVHVSGDVFAIAYQGPSDDGWLVTVEIDSAGSITSSLIDSYEFDTSYSLDPEMVAISGDVYALVFRGGSNEGWLYTIDIDTSGTIDTTPLDTLQFESSAANHAELLNIADEEYAIVYRGPGNDGFVDLVSIETDGTLSTTVTDTLEFDPSTAYFPSPVLVGDDMMAIAYLGQSNDGFLTTVQFNRQASYATDEPTLAPTGSFQPQSITSWEGFDESATKEGSAELYYQLSNDDGATWQYWNGSAWASATATDYNTATELDTHITTFDSTAESILFQAFFVSGGTDNIELDTITITCEDEVSWPFTTDTNYSYDSGEIEVSSGNTSLLATGTGIGGIDTVDDTYEFDTSNGRRPAVTSVSGDIYAIAYTGSGFDGFISTTEMSSDGTLSGTTIDSFEFDTANGEDIDIIHIDGDIYGVAYRGVSNDGFLATIEIDSSGNITGSTLDVLEFDTVMGYDHSLVAIDADTVAVAYRGPNSDGWLTTIDVDASGNLTQVDSLEFDTVTGLYPDMIAIDGDVYAIAYQGSSSDGFLVTVEIDSGGSITSTLIDTLEYDTTYGRYPSVAAIDGDIYAIAYQGPDSDGWLATVDIATDGTIGSSVEDTLEYDTSFASEPSMVEIQDGIVGIAYRGNGSDGFFTIASVDSNGDLDTAVIDTLEYDTSATVYPEVVVLSSTEVGIVYQGTSFDGWIATISLSEAASYSTDSPTIQPSTSTTIDDLLVVTEFIETATTGSGSAIYYQLSTDDGGTWQYWSGSTWATATLDTHYNDASTINTNISTLDVSSGQLLFRAFLVSNGIDGVSLDDVTLTLQQRNDTATEYDFDTPADYSYNSADIDVSSGEAMLADGAIPFQMEVGSATVGDTFSTVSLNNTYTSPVIVAFPEYQNNTLPLSVRMQNVGTTSFEMKLQHADTTPGSLSSETVYYMVVEEGYGTIGSTQIEAHRYDTNTVGTQITGTWFGDAQTYTNTYTTAPIVLHQVMTYDDSDWISTFVRGASSQFVPPETSGFRIGLNGTEVTSTHGTETIGWIAIEPSTGDSIDSVDFEVVQTADAVQGFGTTYTQPFSTAFITSPLVVAAQQEMDGGNGSWLMTSGVTNTDIDLFVDEDQVNDAERSHISETAAYIAFASAFDTTLSSTASSYTTSEPTIQPAASLTATDIRSWSGFEVTEDTSSGSAIYYQLSNDSGATWQFWNGTEWTTASSATDYNTQSDVHTHIDAFDTSAEQLLWRAFLISDGVTQATIEDVTVSYVSTSSGGGYVSSGTLTSSAFDMGSVSPVEVVEWIENVTSCDPNCDITVQVRTAPDDGAGSPDTGNWTDWYGESGTASDFTEPDGTLISTDLNGNEWVQYRVELTGDGSDTPILEEITISY